MKLLAATLASLFATHLGAGPIEDIERRLDSHGLWMNGSCQPIMLPANASDESLAAHFLAVSNRGSINTEILEKKNVSRLRVGLSGVRAMLVRSERIVFFPAQTIRLERAVILYHFGGEERGWWSRVYPVDEEK